MIENLQRLPRQRCRALEEAATDFFFLQNRGYPRASALEWVGNRYALTQPERQLLHRGVFAQGDALRRRSKRCQGADWRNECLVVDGHNVQITVESAILGRSLLIANDGALRDVAGLSARFRFTEASEVALDMIFRVLEEFRPARTLFLFDAPMSHSGLIASRYRQRLKTLGLAGEARAVPVPEREFCYAECVVSSSDHAVLEQARQWLDLARWAIDGSGMLQQVLDFSSLVLTHAVPEAGLRFFPPPLDF